MTFVLPFSFYTYCGWSVNTEKVFEYSVLQGDPLSMFMYAIGTLPLVCSLHNPAQWTQVWYADDATVCSYLNVIHE